MRTAAPGRQGFDAIVIAGLVDFQATAANPELTIRFQQLFLDVGAQQTRSQVLAAAIVAATGSTASTWADTQTLIVADARLDNRMRLLGELGVAQTIDNAALIGCCWQHWGAACVDHLDGDFAFAVWRPHSRELFLGRDALGQRPLFVRRLGPRLAFASSLRPLRLLGPPVSADAVAIADHLMGLPGDLRRSAWREIERVPGGHLIRFSDTVTPQTRRFFWLAPAELTDVRNDADWCEGFRERFNDAVGVRMSPSEPIAATLSGGLDSSAVVATALRLSGSTVLRAYAGRFPMTPDCDEGHHLDQLRSHERLQVCDVDISTASPLATCAQIMPWLDEPILIQNLHLWSSLYRAVRVDGIRIVLDGHDGDSALGRSAATDARARPAPSLLSRTVQQLRRLRSHWQPTAVPSVPALELLNPDFARSTDAGSRWRAFDADRRTAVAGGMRARHAWQLNSGYPAYATERLSSLAHAYGIDPRHPFYDTRLLGWCLDLPAHLKQRDGYSRWILRNALEGTLPDSLRWRHDKTSLSAQFHRAFCDQDAVLVESLLADREHALAQYLDLERVRALWRAYRSSPADRPSVALWSMATLGLWLRETTA